MGVEESHVKFVSCRPFFVRVLRLRFSGVGSRGRQSICEFKMFSIAVCICKTRSEPYRLFCARTYRRRESGVRFRQLGRKVVDLCDLAVSQL